MALLHRTIIAAFHRTSRLALLADHAEYTVTSVLGPITAQSLASLASTQRAAVRDLKIEAPGKGRYGPVLIIVSPSIYLT